MKLLEDHVFWSEVLNIKIKIHKELTRVKFLCNSVKYFKKDLNHFVSSSVGGEFRPDLNRFLRNAKQNVIIWKLCRRTFSFGKATAIELHLQSVYFRKRFTPRNSYYLTRRTTCGRLSVSFVLFQYLSSRSVPVIASANPFINSLYFYSIFPKQSLITLYKFYNRPIFVRFISLLGDLITRTWTQSALN